MKRWSRLKELIFLERVARLETRFVKDLVSLADKYGKDRQDVLEECAFSLHDISNRIDLYWEGVQ